MAEAAKKIEREREEPKPKNLRQKLLAAMSDLEAIEQRGENKTQGYTYVKAADVILAARRALVEHGVVFTATEAEITNGEPMTTRSGAIMSSCRVRMKFSFLDTESDERIDMYSTGEGQDVGDKSIYKSKTGAIKYCLQQNLLIAAGDDAEDDRGEEERVERIRPVNLVPDRHCPNCGNVGSLIKNKATGMWVCWRSKGGCESTFDEAQLAAGPVDPDDVQTPPAEEDTSSRMEEHIVATDEMLDPLQDLIRQSSDPKATEAAILSRCGVRKLSDLTPKQVEWQVSTLQKKLAAREAGKRPRK